MTRIGVLGAGSWGTTLANLLACKGDEVRIWAYEAEVVEAINRAHENPLFLAGVALAPGRRSSGPPAIRSRRSAERRWWSRRRPATWCAR